ncbi:hypothetical protein GBA52_010519 [Prunus armeniaca]|nr:hypothetical protein GBA52_010519 [Prunus armeniaca]
MAVGREVGAVGWEAKGDLESFDSFTSSFSHPAIFCKDGFLSSFTPKSIQPQTPLGSLSPLTKVQTSLLSIRLEGSFPNILWSCWNNLLPLRITAHSPQLAQCLRRQLGGHIKAIR